MGLWNMLKGEEPNPFEALLHYENKGQYGEYATEYALRGGNLPGYGKTLRNVYLPYKGRTSEIDVLLVHEKGLFSFESKNYSGWIFGGEEQQKWTQCLPGGEKHSFYNPIRQNLTHCTALAEFLGVDAAAVSSYIIFSQRCELKRVPADTARCKIVRRPNLLKKLRADLAARPVCFTPQEVDAMAARLECLAHATAEEKAAHVEQIKTRTEGTVCPFCGGQLVLRQGKYGSFWGCSAYPKCRFTRKSTG